ncbi:MAG: hypothetical protein V5A52_02645 [Halovenus sp.]|uniref:hypothetical protein n=1 Tax=Halovenus amylolytica TaxID=2500550 RepID=UPI000FE39EEC
MVSRKNEVVLVCAMIGTVLAFLAADGLDAPPGIASSVLVFVGAILPMVINNYLDASSDS